MSHTGTASTPIGFAGGYADSETGFLYLINRYYDPVTGEFITVDPLYGGTSNPPQSGPGSGSGSQPISIYQLVLGAPTSMQFNGGDPAAGLPANSGDTTGAVAYPNVSGLSDVALAVLSSINGLPETNPGPPNPSYVGAGFFSPNSVSSSGSPYAYVAGDPVNGVDPGGELDSDDVWNIIVIVLSSISGWGGFGGGTPNQNAFSNYASAQVKKVSEELLEEIKKSPGKIPEIFKNLFEEAWLLGHGWTQVSFLGSLLSIARVAGDVAEA